MFEDLFFNFLESEENKDNNYPDYFYLWDDALSENTTHDSLEPEELKDIINIYFSEEELEKARITIDYTLSTYQDEEDILYDIMVILSDYEKWNDLLKLAEQLKDRNEFWVDAHKIEALLHLSMEEEAFQTFQTAKTKYAKETESMSILYLAMGESLLEMDLFESCIDVISEAIDKFGPQIDFYWLQIEANATINDIEEVYSLAEKISELIPFDASSWQRLGLIYKQINDTSKAIEAFEFARNLEYEDKQRNLLELIFAYEKNKNFTKALELTKEYLYLYPSNNYINLLAANLCSEASLWDEAIKFIDKFLETQANMDALYIYKSMFLVNMGEIKKAKQVLLDGIAKFESNEELTKELDKLNNLYPEI